MNNISEKRSKFVRLANIRTNDLLKKIRVLGNLSVKSSYEYSDSDINKIFAEIDSALKLARLRFKSNEKSRKFIIEK